MTKLTEADRTEINRRIAERLGETFRSKEVCKSPEKCTKDCRVWASSCKYYSKVPPDYFTDPAAADRIIGELRKHGCHVVLDISDEGYDGRHDTECHATIGTPEERQTPGIDDHLYKILEFANDWKAALALACVEKGKFCPKCGESIEDFVFHIEDDDDKETGEIYRVCPNYDCQEATDDGEELNWRMRPELEGK